MTLILIDEIGLFVSLVQRCFVAIGSQVPLCLFVCLFVCVGPGNSSDGSPIFQGVSSSPRGGVGTSLPGLTGGIPTRAWDRGGKQTFLTPRPVLS